MAVTVREYAPADLEQMLRVWNAIVEEGQAFPQLETLDSRAGAEFFGAQSHCGVAEEAGRIVGLYILHPNNVGRCGHICNCSYAVDGEIRGRGIGRLLVEDSMRAGKSLGFKIMQFNAVVKSNAGARALYEKLGFKQLGVIPGGFLRKDGVYEDICPYYRTL